MPAPREDRPATGEPDLIPARHEDHPARSEPDAMQTRQEGPRTESATGRVRPPASARPGDRRLGADDRGQTTGGRRPGADDRGQMTGKDARWGRALARSVESDGGRHHAPQRI